MDVPGPGGGAGPGEAQGVAVVFSMDYHVVASVGAADSGRVGTIRVSCELGILALTSAIGFISSASDSVGLVDGEGIES